EGVQEPPPAAAVGEVEPRVGRGDRAHERHVDREAVRTSALAGSDPARGPPGVARRIGRRGPLRRAVPRGPPIPGGDCRGGGGGRGGGWGGGAPPRGGPPRPRRSWIEPGGDLPRLPGGGVVPGALGDELAEVGQVDVLLVAELLDLARRRQQRLGAERGV